MVERRNYKLQQLTQTKTPNKFIENAILKKLEESNLSINIKKQLELKLHPKNYKQ